MHPAPDPAPDRPARLALLRSEIIRAAPPGRVVVFGDGNDTPILAIVGEAPGREEEIAGRPFVGRAGRLLDALLFGEWLYRSGVWVTNVVKWRPTTTKGGKVRTRAPGHDEVTLHRKWLEQELDLVRPAIVLCLGTVAAQAIVDRHFRMSLEHGRWRPGLHGAPAIATFHPAYCLRRGGPDGPVGRLMAEDFRLVKAAYERLMKQPKM